MVRQAGKGGKAGKEAAFERQCVAEARRRGWVCWKNEHCGTTGIPDYSMMDPAGRHIVLIEFKAPDGSGRLGPHQEDWIKRYGHAFVVDGFDRFRDILSVYEKGDDWVVTIDFPAEIGGGRIPLP